MPWPDVAIPPGETVAEILEAKGMTQAELALRTGRPPQAICEIVNGKKAIEPATATQFESVLGIPAYVWLNLERDYQYNKARLEEKKRQEEEAYLVTKFQYAEISKLGWVKKTSDRLERVKELRSFLGVASLKLVPKASGASYRISAAKEPSPQALAAWMRQGELQAGSIQTAPYSATKLDAALSSLRALTRLTPREFEPQLRQTCSDCGVALVFVPQPPKTYAHGAARWLGPERALVQLSIRGRKEDIFWFSFFHEVAHLLLGMVKKREQVIELDTGRHECRADRFAAEILLPPEQLQRLTRRGPLSEARVRAFAEEIGVCPAVVVGRLQHEKLLPRTHLNGLRRTLKWADE